MNRTVFPTVHSLVQAVIIGGIQPQQFAAPSAPAGHEGLQFSLGFILPFFYFIVQQQQKSTFLFGL